MEGSPVRSQERVSISRLNESCDVQTFQGEIIRLLGFTFKHVEILFGIVEKDSSTIQLPAWIRSHLERQPSLQKRLDQGEIVEISAKGADNLSPRPAAAARSRVVLVPAVSENQLIAVIGFVCDLDSPPFLQEDIEIGRQLAQEAAPILARLQQVERLQRENQELRGYVREAERTSENTASLEAQTDLLDATLEMRSHQQRNIAHELRTPLAAIRGYVRMIVDGRGGEISETQKDYLRIVTDNTNRLIALIGWMSYVAELSAQYLKLSSFDFREIWTECAASSERELAGKSLKLTQQIADEPFRMIGDREKLAYVLKELVAVGIQLADAGGTLSVELSHGREKEVTFKLVERGAAIPASVLSKIYERSLNTVPQPMAQKKEPGAINLSAVYDIVGMHGGRVFVNSTAGPGATFLFTLPAVKTGEENSYEQAVNSGRRRR